MTARTPVTLDRRTFLEVLGVTGASTLVACNGAPREVLHAYLRPLREVTPGVATWYATVCRACPAGCGLLVRTREARPVKCEGNPLHPVNRGRLCARGQAVVQGLYGAQRIQRPLVRRAGSLEPASWETALEAAAGPLRSAASVALLTGLESGSFDDLLADLVPTPGTPCLAGAERLAWEPLVPRALGAASALLFGRDEIPAFDLSPADHVLSLGADLLDTFLSPVRFAAQWADRHGWGPEGRRLVLEYAGPRRNLTATAADAWHRMSASRISEVAAMILGGLLEKRRGALPAEVLPLVDEAAARVGARAPDAETAPLVERLHRAAAPLVLFGGQEVAGADATAVHAAVLLTDLLLGAIGTRVRYGTGHALSRTAPAARVLDVVDRAASGALDVLLVHGANPARTLPGPDRVGSLQRAKHLVVLASEMDRTAAAAHVVLPVHHPLESWGDFDVDDATSGLLQPTRSPLYDSRHAGDVLLELARRSGATPRFATYREYVVARWTARAGDLRLALGQGGRFVEPAPPAAVTLLPARLAELPTVAPPPTAGSGAVLVVATSALHHDGRGSLRPWLMETPDPLSQTCWTPPIELAEDVGGSLGVRTGDEVSLEGAGGEGRATAWISPDLAPGHAALRMGAKDAPVLALLPGAVDPTSGDLVLAGARITLRRHGAGTLTTVSGGSEAEGRFLCPGVEASEARSGLWPVLTRHGEIRPGPEGHEEGGHGEGHGVAPVPLPTPLDDVAAEGSRPADNMYVLAGHPDHRWGLVVDLDRCTGCGACVVACYAENNVAVVGAEQVRKGREQAWIRIETHVAEEHGHRRVRFLPVMCQQCAQAPCESVCPVFASYHTPDGLNGQVYNRCIGTRYCANNCPYKVRRFNYFDWERRPPGNQQLNPDVTVRTRGIMEKCTFCIQRIREVTQRAAAEGRPVREGEIVPACVQTCPTGALAFGDWKKADAAIVALARDPRGYRLLDWMLNTKPGVVYLRRVHSEPEEG